MPRAEQQLVPHPDQAAELAPMVRVQVVQGVHDGNAVAPQVGDQGDVPQVHAGEVHQVGLRIADCGLRIAECGKAEALGGEAGVGAGQRRVDAHRGRVTIGGQPARGDQMHLVAGEGQTVGQVGGVLVHAEGGGEQDVADAH